MGMRVAWMCIPVVVAAPFVMAAGLAAPAVSVVAATASGGSSGGSAGSGTSPAVPVDPPPDPSATSDIPPEMLALYRFAAVTCPGLPWQILAAIGTEESGNGTSFAAGVHSGANYAGAEGPMQFEPATFASFDRPVPPGGADPPSPYDPADAVYAAARMLCADGGSHAITLGNAIFDYNHSDAYVAAVMAIAGKYGYEGVVTPSAMPGSGP